MATHLLITFKLQQHFDINNKSIICHIPQIPCCYKLKTNIETWALAKKMGAKTRTFTSNIKFTKTLTIKTNKKTNTKTKILTKA
jgi:hypothetical protein